MKDRADRGRGRLTPAQEQIWRLHHGLAEVEVLDMHYALGIDGPLDVPALEEAMRALCRRHEPLRTLYPAVDGSPVARVAEHPVFTLEQADLTPLDAAERLVVAAEKAVGQSRHRFDLAAGPLLRATLLRLAAEQHVLLLNFHHISADGWSLEIFGREGSALYAALREGRDAGLGELAVQCIDHAEQQAAWLDGPAARRQADWWAGYLRGVSPAAFTLPADRPEVGESLEMSRLVLPLSRELTDELREVARRRGASLYMILLAALDVLIARWAGTEDVVVGTLVANRETPTAGRILGAHYNPLLLRTSLAGDPCLGEVLMRVAESSLPALERQGLPFARVAGIAAAEAGVPPRRIPAVVLQLDRYPMHALALAGARVTGLHADPAGARAVEDLAAPRRLRAASPADLTFFVRDEGGRLTVSIFYRTRRFHDATAGRLARSFAEILLAFTERLEDPFREVPLPLDESPELPEPPLEGGPASLFPITAGCPVDALSPLIALPLEAGDQPVEPRNSHEADL